MMHVLGGVAGLAAEHVAIDPEIAGFFLRKGVEDAARTQRAQQSTGVGAAGVVALPAAAVKAILLLPYLSTMSRSRSAISEIATSHSISSKPPSARRRSGVVSRSL